MLRKGGERERETGVHIFARTRAYVHCTAGRTHTCTHRAAPDDQSGPERWEKPAGLVTPTTIPPTDESVHFVLQKVSATMIINGLSIAAC